MHGEQAVENLGRNKIVVRADKLDADNCRLDPADHKKHQSINDVQNPQALVINGRNPIVEPRDDGTRC
jgi:hypothetical protein